MKFVCQKEAILKDNSSFYYGLQFSGFPGDLEIKTQIFLKELFLQL